MKVLLIVLICGFASIQTVAEPLTRFSDSQTNRFPSGRIGFSKCGFLRGRPLPDCQTFFLFESSLKYRVGGKNQREGKSNYLITVETGVLKNVSPKWAIGLMLYTGFDDDGHQIGLRPRLRRWMTNGWGLDLSPGIILSADNNRGEVKTPGFVGSVSLEQADWFAFDFQYQKNTIQVSPSSVPVDQRANLSDQTVSDVYLGVRFGSYLGLVSPVVLALLIGATWN